MIEEDKIIDLVKKWVNRNPAEFREPETNKRLYRETIFKRCKRYLNAPDEYLNFRKKTLPEERKWFFNVFQTVFLVGIFGLETSFLVLFLNNLSAWFQKLSLDLNVLSWLLPLVILLVTVALSLKQDKRHKTSWLSGFIQKRFRILHNLRELDIEMYCVSTIIESRKEKETENLG